MKLWTLQGKASSITEGIVRHDLSEYSGDPNFPGLEPAYDSLASHLGTDQYLWCYTTTKGELSSLPTMHKVLWTLDVPADRILAFVSSSTWNKILGIQNFCPPESLRIKWKTQALEQAPHDPAKRKEIEEKLKGQFYAPEAEAVLWDRLFLDELTPEDCHAIIPFPVEPSWIITSQPC